MSETLTVIVNRVCYPAETVEGASWFILDTDQGTCKGNMPWRPKPKERLKLEGDYSVYQGKREFKFKSAQLDLPTDSRGLLRYVCELASGVGEALEMQIWELKGEAWSEIEEGEVPRLKGKSYDNFIKAIEIAEGDRAKGETIAQLMSAGCTINMANAAYEKWEKNTMGVVSSDPYRLAELPKYGFGDVDNKIRYHFGIEDGDPRRIRAAVIYVLRQITQGGSTLVNWDELFSACIKHLDGFNDLILQSVSSMFKEGTLRGFKSSRAIALASDCRNETIIWDYIQLGGDW